MLTFKQFIEEEKKAKAFVAQLLEAAARSQVFALTKDERKRMTEILKMFPHILERNGPEHVTYVGSKTKPDLESYDMWTEDLEM